MCDCIDKLYKEVSAEFPDVEFTNVAQFGNMKTGNFVDRPEPLRLKRNAMKDGKPLKKMVRSYIAFRYCPWCREEY